MKADLLQFGSLLTWWWLPSLGSQLLLSSCYSLHILAPPTSPPLRNKHLQVSRAIVIIGTLIYQLVQASITAPPNFYQLLSLPLDVDADHVRRSFRSLARRYHPDKVGESGEAFFILLRQSHDVLSDPIRRFAYDRFGPSIVQWKDCSSQRDFLRHGLMSMVAFYTINPAMYALFGYINNSSSHGVSFWRLACLFSLLAFELCLLISPDYPVWMSLLLPTTTIFQVRAMAHSLFVNFFFASLQLCTALDALEYGPALPATRQRDRAAVAEAQFAAIQHKAKALDTVADTIKAAMLQSLARELRPLRMDVEGSAGKEEREMGKDEEEVFAKIDRVLLSRSLVQQHPQLLAMAKAMAQSGEAVKMEKEEAREEGKQQRGETIQMAKAELEQQVKSEQTMADTVRAPIVVPIAVKAEQMEESWRESSTAVAVQPAANSVDDSMPRTEVKSEPVVPNLTTDESKVTDPGSANTAADPSQQAHDQAVQSDAAAEHTMVEPQASLQISTDSDAAAPQTQTQTQGIPTTADAHPKSDNKAATQQHIDEVRTATAAPVPITFQSTSGKTSTVHGDACVATETAAAPSLR